MLSNWLFTTAIAASAIFGTSFAAPGPKDNAIESRNTINLLKDGLPPYRKADDKDGLLKLTYGAVNKLIKDEKARIKKEKGPKKGGCDLTKIKVRRDWAVLPKSEKKGYTAAIHCLASLPSRTNDPVNAPGVLTRYDDFTALHIVQTQSVHGTANFLHWHRYYIWLFEKALVEECGYKGAFPYWNWGSTSQQPYPSNIFNDGEYGLSGDGEYEPHNLNGTGIGPVSSIIVPVEESGGGCVRTGPFANWTINLGPVLPTLDLVPPITGSHLQHNPRCMRRAISPYIAQRWTTASDLFSLLTSPLYPTIGPFQNRLSGDFVNGYVGLHAGGHFTIGGDPQGDLYSAPGDPAFWPHHTQVDRVWWLWQLQDEQRLWQVDGTITFANIPPSRNGTLDDWLEMGYVSDVSKRLREVVDTTREGFCYIYL